jgi:AcrR family transcriptional regulator
MLAPDGNRIVMAGVRQFDEQAVLETAMDVFWRRGFAETSMCDLARATKVQRGSLYHAYAGKEAIFLAAYDMYAARFLDKARAALAHPDAREAVRSLLEAGIASMRSGRPARGCFSTRMMMEAADESAAVRARVRRTLDTLEELVAARLGEARASGAFAGDARAGARLVVALTRGLAVIERAYGDVARLREIAEEGVRGLFAAVAER